MTEKNIQNNESALQTVIDSIAVNGDSALVFTHDGIAIKPGYHVTEIKHAKINSLDCGSGTDSWEEIVIQILDGSSLSLSDHMSGSKFLNILRGSMKTLEISDNTQLYFEYAPGNGPIRKLTAESIRTDDDATTISLSGASASCKPFERAKESLGVGAACCGPSSSSCC